MPRYYFDLFNDITSVDDEGVQLRNDAAAMREGLKNARVMAADSVCHGKLNLRHRIEVRGAQGRSVGTFYFGDVVKIETQDGSETIPT